MYILKLPRYGPFGRTLTPYYDIHRVESTIDDFRGLDSLHIALGMGQHIQDINSNSDTFELQCAMLSFIIWQVPEILA